MRLISIHKNDGLRTLAQRTAENEGEIRSWRGHLPHP